MKIEIVLIAFVLGFVIAQNTNNVDDEFEAFKIKFHKVYKNAEEENYRKSIFIKTFEMINRHNEKYARGEVTYNLGINKFADLREDELPRGLLIRHKV